MPHQEFITPPEIRYLLVSGKLGYRVGDDGSVWSRVIGGRYPRLGETWRPLKPHPNVKSGHMSVWLGRADPRYVHALVLETFVGPCPPGLECLHGDGDPGNNHLWNLRWGTPAENHADSVRHGTSYLGCSPRLGTDHPAAKLDESMIRRIMKLRAETGKGAGTIAKQLGLGFEMRGAVEGVLRGQSWNHVTGLPPYRPQSHTTGRRKRVIPGES